MRMLLYILAGIGSLNIVTIVAFSIIIFKSSISEEKGENENE